MARIGDIVDVLESWAPISLAESWDNVGLLSGDPDNTVTSVLICLDITGQTLERAAALENPLIVSHHPLMLKPLASFAGKDRVSQLIRRIIADGIPVYSAHTNLDRAPGGVSHALASWLGCTGIVPLTSMNSRLYKFVTYVPIKHTDSVRQAAGDAGAGVIGEYNQCSFTVEGIGTFIPSDTASPYKGSTGKLSREMENRLEMIVPEPKLSTVVDAVRKVHPYEEMAYDLIPLAQNDPMTGFGAIGTLPSPLKRSEYLSIIGARLDVKTLSVSVGGSDIIKRVAVMGGSGRSMIEAALHAGADSYVTGEIGHHAMLDYGNDILLVDATHRATELPVLKVIRDRLNYIFSDTTCTVDIGQVPYAVQNMK